MCNRYSSKLRKPLHQYYASVDRIAREVGAEIQERHQSEMRAFDLCTSGDIEQVVQSVWIHRERHHSVAMEDLLANPVTRMSQNAPSGREWMFKIRADALLAARQLEKSVH